MIPYDSKSLHTWKIGVSPFPSINTWLVFVFHEDISNVVFWWRLQYYFWRYFVTRVPWLFFSLTRIANNTSCTSWGKTWVVFYVAMNRCQTLIVLLNFVSELWLLFHIYFQDHCQIIATCLLWWVLLQMAPCLRFFVVLGRWSLKNPSQFFWLGSFFSSISMFPEVHEGTMSYIVMICLCSGLISPHWIHYLLIYWRHKRPWSAPICTTRTKSDQ